MSEHRAETTAPHGRQVQGPMTGSVGIERIDDTLAALNQALANSRDAVTA